MQKKRLKQFIKQQEIIPLWLKMSLCYGPELAILTNQNRVCGTTTIPTLWSDGTRAVTLLVGVLPHCPESCSLCTLTNRAAAVAPS